MKRFAFSIAWAAACLQTLAFVSGCSSGVVTSSGTQPQQPYITSFTPGTITIEAGTSTTLTPVFAGGTGVITPGNLVALSGTAVTVTPSATTTYTLTVTGSSGSIPATEQTTILVNPAPGITSFTASPNQIESGSSTILTGSFAGGSGVITGPGNFSASVTSGQQLSVTPPATTTDLGQQTLPMKLTLQPWSMNVVIVQP